MDWRSSDCNYSFRYVRVDPKTFADIEDLTMIQDGGKIDRNYLASITTSGSVPYIGKLDLGNDLMRIYATATSPDGDSETVALGTFLVSKPNTTRTGAMIGGIADLYGLTLWLQQIRPDDILSIPAGTNAVIKAVSMIQSVGLTVSADPSSMMLSSTRNYGGDDWDYLGIVNDLLSVAGFESAGLDGMGTVTVRSYTDPSNKAPSITWASGDGSVFAPEVTHTFDDFFVPNKLTLICSRIDEPPLVATAINSDPSNRFSTVARGRTIPVRETIDDIANQAALNARAKARLVDLTSVVESVEIVHAYEPFDMGAGASLDYKANTFPDGTALAGVGLAGVIVSSSTALSPLMLTKTRIRRFVRM